MDKNMRCQLKQDGHEKPNYRELTENTHCVIPRYLGILSGIQEKIWNMSKKTADNPLSKNMPHTIMSVSTKMQKESRDTEVYYSEPGGSGVT